MNEFSAKGPLKPLFEDVKVGKGKKQMIMTSPSCPICYAQNKDGEDIRLKVDKFFVTHEVRDTLEMLRRHNINVSVGDLNKHFKSHSRYINEIKENVKKVAEKTALSKIEDLEADYIDAEEVIQDIITIGGKRVKTGEMMISDKLLLGALREQGERKKTGTLQQIFMELDRARFVNGEIEDKDKPLLEDGNRKE